MADAGRLKLQHFHTTVPHLRRRFLRRNRQYLYRMMYEYEWKCFAMDALVIYWQSCLGGR